MAEVDALLLLWVHDCINEHSHFVLTAITPEPRWAGRRRRPPVWHAWSPAGAASARTRGGAPHTRPSSCGCCPDCACTSWRSWPWWASPLCTARASAAAASSASRCCRAPAASAGAARRSAAAAPPPGSGAAAGCPAAPPADAPPGRRRRPPRRPRRPRRRRRPGAGRRWRAACWPRHGVRWRQRSAGGRWTCWRTCCRGATRYAPAGSAGRRAARRRGCWCGATGSGRPCSCAARCCLRHWRGGARPDEPGTSAGWLPSSRQTWWTSRSARAPLRQLMAVGRGIAIARLVSGLHALFDCSDTASLIGTFWAWFRGFMHPLLKQSRRLCK